MTEINRAKTKKNSNSDKLLTFIPKLFYFSVTDEFSFQLLNLEKNISILCYLINQEKQIVTYYLQTSGLSCCLKTLNNL